MKATEKDPWKEWTAKHREELDTKAPKDLWANIEKELDSPVQKKSGILLSLWQARRIAAVFIGLLGLGYILMYQHFSAREKNTESYAQNLAVSEYPAELMEAENYYVAEIDSRMSELIALTDDKVIVEEINSLKEEFDALKEELGDQINDEKLIQAMIQNYRLRLSLLKEILQELKGNNSQLERRTNEERI